MGYHMMHAVFKAWHQNRFAFSEARINKRPFSLINYGRRIQ